MTFSYSVTAPQSSKDRVRLLVNDTTSAYALLQDEEIATLIALECGDPNGSVNVYRVAAEAADQIAMQYGRLGERSDEQMRARYELHAADYQKRAALLRQRAQRSGGTAYAGGISQVDKDANRQNTDTVEPMFTRDMITAPGTSTAALPVVAIVPGGLV